MSARVKVTQTSRRKPRSLSTFREQTRSKITFLSTVVGRMDANDEIFKRILDDRDFRDLLADFYVRKGVRAAPREPVAGPGRGCLNTAPDRFYQLALGPFERKPREEPCQTWKPGSESEWNGHRRRPCRHNSWRGGESPLNHHRRTRHLRTATRRLPLTSWEPVAFQAGGMWIPAPSDSGESSSAISSISASSMSSSNPGGGTRSNFPHDAHS